MLSEFKQFVYMPTSFERWGLANFMLPLHILGLRHIFVNNQTETETAKPNGLDGFQPQWE